MKGRRGADLPCLISLNHAEELTWQLAKIQTARSHVPSNNGKLRQPAMPTPAKLALTNSQILPALRLWLPRKQRKTGEQ